jgi:hypothetical protein
MRLPITIVVAIIGLACAQVRATVTIDESQPTVMKAQTAQVGGSTKSIDPSTAETPSNERRPVGTAISGVNNATPISKQGTQALSMKCWQDGKLIIDQPVKALPADAQKNSTMTNAATGTSVYAFDFKNAMCIVK